MGHILSMLDAGFFLSFQAVSHQLAAMPAAAYAIRLIHVHTRRPFPGQRLWTASQLLDEHVLRFLRARNREGFEVYFRPHAGERNAGYVLIDLDDSPPSVIAAMRANGHAPCVVAETSPGHWQAWIRVCAEPLSPALATQIARRLAQLYHGDRASADWRHVGRLAGFTNRKPQRRLPNGWPPWVRLQQAQPCLAANGDALVAACLRPQPRRVGIGDLRGSIVPPLPHVAHNPAADSAAAAAIYQTCLTNLRIPQRFPHPDWSIADLWIAQALLGCGVPGTQVKSILRLASPGFPRSHSDPEDYLQRTLLRAVQGAPAQHGVPFPARPAASSAD